MAKGFAVPVRTNKRGGAQLIQGTPYTEQCIRVGLTPNYSRNPFQTGGGVEVGISEQIVFSVNAASVMVRARREVTRFFARLREAEIARLAPEDGLVMENAGEELIARVKYVDLEADREGEVESNLKDALQSSPRVNYSGAMGGEA
jgi:hypothetical protein